MDVIYVFSRKAYVLLPTTKLDNNAINLLEMCTQGTYGQTIEKNLGGLFISLIQ